MDTHRGRDIKMLLEWRYRDKRLEGVLLTIVADDESRKRVVATKVRAVGKLENDWVDWGIFLS